MDKFITLCFECRSLFKDHYRLEAYDTDVIPEAKGRDGKKAAACENCGNRFDLRVCRIRSKGGKY